MHKNGTLRRTHLLDKSQNLFDFRLFEIDVLSRDGIVLLEDDFLRRGPRIFFGDVEEPCTCGAQQLDFLGDWLCHGLELRICAELNGSGTIASERLL